MDITNLSKIGFTKGELKVYNALLELGEATRTELVKKSGISSSKIYEIANRLKEKGVISTIKKNKILHFSAADPKELQTYIEKKKKEIHDEETIVQQILPTLLAKYEKTEENVDVEVFYGWEGMTTAFNDIVKTLRKGEYNYIFGASQGANSNQADIFFNQYYQKKKKKGFGTKIIFNEEVRDNKKRTSIFQEAPNEIRFLHDQTFTEINLYKNIVLVILLQKTPTIIRIRNKETADAFKKFFDTLWKQAKK